MNKMTFKQIKEIINSYFFINDLGYYLEYPEESDIDINLDSDNELDTQIEIILKSNSDNKIQQVFQTLGLGEFEVLDSYGGEGKGDDYWLVFYLKQHNIYIKLDGYYQSYDGGYYTSMYEVKPKQVMMTIYE